MPRDGLEEKKRFAYDRKISRGVALRDVLVEIFTGVVDYQVVARFDGTNDRGIVLNGAEPGEGAVFYPWRLIVVMRLAREEDLAGPPG